LPNIKSSPFAAETVSYLKGAGSALIAFETETSTLTSPSSLTSDHCKDVEGRVANDLSGGMIFDLIRQVKDPVLNESFTQDINNKTKLLAECARGEADSSTIALVQKSSDTVGLLLTQLGLQP
jgi:hypothetical protein